MPPDLLWLPVMAAQNGRGVPSADGISAGYGLFKSRLRTYLTGQTWRYPIVGRIRSGRLSNVRDAGSIGSTRT
jgi:hypothetical protein